MNNGDTEWKVTAAEFRGYMKANIEDIKEQLKEIKRENKLQSININKNKDDITTIKTSAGVISGFVSFVIVIVGFILQHLRGK